MSDITRRALVGGAVVAAGTVLGGARTVMGRRLGLVPPDAGGMYGPGETMAYAAHRLLGRNALAREFPKHMVSAKPFANEITPPSEAFKRHQASGFASWRLAVHGHFARPGLLSLAELRTLETRSQITEVSCEEGWSYVAKWTGTPLAAVLRSLGVLPTARYLAYYSSDPDWWETIDIDEAMHPQTLLAWGMNDADLPVPFGGPLRMRVPRQLGYKSVKFVNRLVVTDSLEGFGDGQSVVNRGYAWYAGI
jgi:DMSO/TMAO reductase YedYZ molybdopterin-dependent catalytic subunit